jgi:hypothetical protein
MKSIILPLSISLAFSLYAFSSLPNRLAQDEVVEAKEVTTPPVIDGIADDACWADAKWQAIDQVWIPWGTPPDPSDFTGKYKVAWSSEQNLLYFIVEINDDVVSDSYVNGMSSAIYNFDMIEVFIDEDKSGGYHVFDGTANDETSLGTNAENAFAYHIFAKIPPSGQSSHSYCVEDIAGTSWASNTNPDYSDHFPEFITRHQGNVTTYEFSLIVYNDTYSPINKTASRATLTAGKIMGLSLAANDDDQPEIDPAETQRDNMIGSVAVTEEAYNNHWKIADDFGTIKLVSDRNNNENLKKKVN